MELLNKIKRKLGIRDFYPSETSKVRPLVIRFCTGRGCDVGHGGDKIVKENCDGIDFERPYAYTGRDKTDIAVDLNESTIPVADGWYDYVYSSHLIEDFKDTGKILEEFFRILKSGGNLILVFPDQTKYEAYCQTHQQIPNANHVHANMSMDYMIRQFKKFRIPIKNLLYSSNCAVDYNCILVIKKP